MDENEDLVSFDNLDDQLANIAKEIETGETVEDTSEEDNEEDNSFIGEDGDDNKSKEDTNEEEEEEGNDNVSSDKSNKETGIDYKAEYSKLKEKIDKEEAEKNKAPYTDEELFNLKKPSFEDLDYDSEKYEKEMTEYYKKAQYKSEMNAQSEVNFHANIEKAGYKKDDYIKALEKTNEASKELNINIDHATVDKIKSYDNNISMDIAYYLGDNIEEYKQLLNMPIYKRVDKINDIAKIVEKKRKDNEKLSDRKKAYQSKKDASDPISAQKNKLMGNKQLFKIIDSIDDINSIEDFEKFEKRLKK